MRDKRMTPDEVVAELADGMTVGIGGWGSRRKPMALVRAILRSPVTDLTVVSYGGPDVGLLCAAGKVRKLVYGFVSLDTIPYDPWFRRARETGAIDVLELDEGMFQCGLRAAGHRLPFLPIRAGLGSDVLKQAPELRTVRSPYNGEELVAMPALHLDVALVHLNRADRHGNAQYLGPDPYFDDLFCLAAKKRYVSCEQIVETAELTAKAPVQSLLLNRMMVDGVVETPGGAHFTSCVPDYGRDEAFQREYAEAAGDLEKWPAFYERVLSRSAGCAPRPSRTTGRSSSRSWGGTLVGSRDVTRAEVCVAACADLFAGAGETLASPMGLLPSLGARLARLTTEPDLLLSDGEAFLLDPESTVEGWLPYRKVFDVVAHGRRHVVMGANQIDRFGNQNISCIGDHQKPTRQLLGFRGAPGNTANHRTSYWVPRHSKRVFVEKVDVVSGVGYDHAVGSFHDVHRVVTNLAVLDFGTPDHSMRLVSVHPGVEVDEVLRQTSFPLHHDDVGETRLPTDEELDLLRNVLDPDGKRDAL